MNYQYTYPLTQRMLRSGFDGANSVVKFKREIANVQSHTKAGKVQFAEINKYFDGEIDKQYQQAAASERERYNIRKKKRRYVIKSALSERQSVEFSQHTPRFVGSERRPESAPAGILRSSTS